MTFMLLDIGGCYSSPCLGDSECIAESNLGYSCRCPDGFNGRNCGEFEFNELTYHVFGELKSWTDARTSCEEMGMFLTSITTQDVFDALRVFSTYVWFLI